MATIEDINYDFGGKRLAAEQEAERKQRNREALMSVIGLAGSFLPGVGSLTALAPKNVLQEGGKVNRGPGVSSSSLVTTHELKGRSHKEGGIPFGKDEKGNPIEVQEGEVSVRFEGEEPMDVVFSDDVKVPGTNLTFAQLVRKEIGINRWERKDFLTEKTKLEKLSDLAELQESLKGEQELEDGVISAEEGATVERPRTKSSFLGEAEKFLPNYLGSRTGNWPYMEAILPSRERLSLMDRPEIKEYSNPLEEIEYMGGNNPLTSRNALGTHWFDPNAAVTITESGGKRKSKNWNVPPNPLHKRELGKEGREALETKNLPKPLISEDSSDISIRREGPFGQEASGLNVDNSWGKRTIGQPTKNFKALDLSKSEPENSTGEENTNTPFQRNFLPNLLGGAAQLLSNIPVLSHKHKDIKLGRVQAPEVDYSAERDTLKKEKQDSLAIARNMARESGSTAEAMNYLSAMQTGISGDFGTKVGESYSKENRENMLASFEANKMNQETEFREKSFNAASKAAVDSAKHQAMYDMGDTAAGLAKDYNQMTQEDALITAMMAGGDYDFGVIPKSGFLGQPSLYTKRAKFGGKFKRVRRKR